MEPSIRRPRIGLGALALVVLLAGLLPADGPADLSRLDPDVLTKEQRAEAGGAVDRAVRRWTDEANRRNREAWGKITTRGQWETYRDARIAALRKSLGTYPPAAEPRVKVTGGVDGAGFRIDNVVFESRPGQWVTANLYHPATPGKGRPGLLIAHCHHRDKPESELQDMGMTWARAGCVVLVIDQVGYGERRAHPFATEKDYPKPFRVTRQDYFFRHDSGLHLHLLGDSLMGWMAWDLMRAVDVLLARDDVDPKRIILLGSVAGGGDPAGVTAALDGRIAGCVPFNFGGPQPETPYPLPEDAETTFNYLGGAYWESTRGLRLGGRDDFPHWVITASLAPRRLIHAHEFSWDGERDPVWKRYQKVWGDFYDARDAVGVAHGQGGLKGRPPEASHCNNIGRVHRRMIHPLFEKWFGIRVGDKDEFSAPRKREELISLTPAAREALAPRSLTESMTAVGAERVAAARKRLAARPPAERRAALREAWGRLLGPVTPEKAPTVELESGDVPLGGVEVQRVVLEVEPGVIVPVVIVGPEKRGARGPVVVGVAQAGKAGFLKERAAEVRKLVEGGAVVVLPDLRGTGELRAGASRGKDSADTNRSAQVQLFGRTMVGERLRDLRAVLAHVRARPDLDGKRLALWGDSFTPPTAPGTSVIHPRGVDGWPREPEPLGGLLALLGALYEDDVKAVYLAGGLASYHAVLGHHAVHVPHDAVVPGALTAGDLSDLAGGLAPRPLRVEALVDHLNRPVPSADLKSTYAPTAAAYSATPAAFSLAAERSSPAAWLLGRLK